jgi:signal transduction histidine kinase
MATPERLTPQIDKLKQALDQERARLLKIQAALQQVTGQPDIDANLADMAAALRASGWGRVVVALLGERLAVESLITVGLTPQEEETYYRQILPEAVWDRLAEGELEERRIGHFYFVPAENGDTTDSVWNADDLLFAVLRLGQEPVSGVIRLEAPDDGQRPTAESLREADILVSQTTYIAENARSARILEEQVEELSMMHRADRELSSQLDVERVITLTMDWALRRTGADTGLLMLMTDDRRGLVPTISIGYFDRERFPFNQDRPLPASMGIMGRAARTGETQLVRDVSADEDYVSFLPDAKTQLSVPLAMRGEVLGVITLASTELDAFGEHDMSFLERLGRRAAVALDNARLFRQSEQMADDMSILYSASRAITATLERAEVLQRIVQAMAVTLEGSSAVIFDYQPELDGVEVLAVYRVGTAQGAREKLPEVHQLITFSAFPALQTAAEQHHPLVLRAVDPAISGEDRAWLENSSVYAIALLPLVAQNELVGLAAVVEGRRDRIFSANEMFKGEALASQASVAMRQSMLFGEVMELEKIKSEMIRMASHDLRNPLNNIMGYVELLVMTMSDTITADQQQYIDTLRRNIKSMRTLLEDLLTLERIESERQSEWQPVDVSGLTYEVVESQRSSADLKGHTLTLMRPDEPVLVRGSETQLRQAIANLVGNAIKYTPDGGTVDVRLVEQGDRLRLSVKDNGYGIAPERHARIFERFYRAKEPGTDHIGGTGLGLSLVKTVIERHGGQVWFESAPGAGSTFGFWLPLLGGE